jgi:hypothetical protein
MDPPSPAMKETNLKDQGYDGQATNWREGRERHLATADVPSFMIVYTKNGVSRFIALENIQEIQFRPATQDRVVP